ncbi:YadA-like family protein, partial [Dialister micraerophilus]|uniref:YadA-like family protein n=1 Tax=Dialister micraerophilus TaxID=309120 RepID=UPI0023F38160
QNKDGTEKVEIKKDGITIGSGNTAVALTKDGLNMGGQEITNVKESTTTTSAATVGQVEKVKTELSNTIANKADYALAKGDGQDGAYKVTDGKITLKVKNKTKPDEAAEDVVIDDVASKSSLDALKEEMKKNIQVGGKGANGADGVDGTIGVNGADGKPGIGINGKDGGSITIHGTNGADGQDGENVLTIRGVDGKNGEKGEKGVDGKDINRIVTVDPNGTKHQLATLDDGLKFAGDSGDAIAKKLNETVTISGGVTEESKLTDKNVGVVAKDGKLNVKLAKNLTGLESATFTKTVENNGKKETTSTVINDSGTTVTDKDGNTNKTTADGTVIQNKDGTEKVEIKKDGITITDVEDGTSDNPKKKISLTKDEFNNGGNKITNIANGEKDSDAATVGQVNAAKKAAMDTLAAGFDVKAGNVTGTVSLQANAKPTIEFLSAGNGLSVDLTTDAATHTQKITYRLSDTPVFGEKAEQGEAGKPGKVGKDGKVEVIGKDGSSVVINGKDGSIGLNGTNGQNGLSIRGEKGTEGKPGVDGTTVIKRIVVTDSDGNNPHSVATLDDGLKFAGDSGDAIAKKLNEAVTISGGVTDETKLTDKNVGVVAKDGKLNVKLAKNLTGLESATFTDKDGNTNKTTAGGTVIQNKAGTEKVEITKNGITIMDAGDGTLANPGKTISLTKDGFDNGGNKITNIADGTSDNDAATVGQVNAAKEEAKKHTTVEAGDHLSIKEETDKNGGKKYTITGPSITSEDGSVTVEDNTDKGKKIGYKLSVNTEKIAEKIGKTEIESGDTSTAEVTSTKDAKTNKTTYKVNVKDMHVESGEISYDKGEGTLTLKHKDGEKVEVKGIRNTYTESGEYDEKGKRIKFNRNGEKPFYVDMSKLVNGMNFGIAKLDNKINRVGSGAAALAALKPLEFDPEDKWDVAVGYGNYMGANSLALGAFYRPNENTMFSLGGSFGDGENIINVGLSMKVGKGIQRFISKAEMANRIVEQDAEIAQLKAKDAQREAEIKALREKDEQRELQMKEILKKLNMA